MKPSIPEPQQAGLLDSSDHSRASIGLRYVYPVVSRRAGGVSVGINLNPNNACNWRCIYCQVPNLQRGNAPPIDLSLLEAELRALLEDLLHGDFMIRRVPEDSRRIVDIAFSGNGEPTSAREFPQAVDLVMQLMAELELTIKLRLITNGSLIDRPLVREGITRLGRGNGEVWFKLDAATRDGMERINGVVLDPTGVARRLRDCAGLCSTWVQTCCFLLDDRPPDETEILAWLQILDQTKTSLAGVHLYGLARPSQQSEASRLKTIPMAWLEMLAERVRQLGLTVQVSP
jgi:wyosine [tRNA(Phe)-imidazoG37] synthetase (radical SAM superfamily)